MLSSNQIAVFFDDQYLWKKYISIFDFLCRNIHKEKVACEVTTLVGCVQACTTTPKFP